MLFDIFLTSMVVALIVRLVKHLNERPSKEKPMYRQDEEHIEEEDTVQEEAPMEEPKSMWNWSSKDCPMPSYGLLEPNVPRTGTNDKGGELVELLKTFGVECSVVEVVQSYAVTLYQLKLAKGVRVSKVNALVADIELNLPAKSVRIVPPSNEGANIAIEVANARHETLKYRGALPFSKTVNKAIPFVVGKDVYNNTVSVDVAKLPHLLVAGSTGSGKSVCINDLICSVLYNKDASEVKMLLIDPKMVELSVYDGIPHLLAPVITNVNEAVANLKMLVVEMDRRYALLKDGRCRNIEGYNAKTVHRMPYVLVVIDEFADLMRYARNEIEPIIDRLAAMSRAVGIHLVMATQRPSSDVITGTIKNNFPARLALKVSSAVNSRIILDEGGAEKLVGNGDALLSIPGGDLRRVQCAYLSDADVERTVDCFKRHC